MPKVHRRERADGVDVRLQAFLDWWEAAGPFELTVLRDGGVRWDQAMQLAFFQAGKSKAKNLSETPHGRGGALDVAPFVNGDVPWMDWGLFERMGILAEDHGFIWGGRWENPKDGPHIQVADWRSLAFPPLAADEEDTT